MTDTARIREFLDDLGARLDELYLQREPGWPRGPSIEDILNDPREFPKADNDPGVQYALGWLRGAAEILDQTVLEFLWDHDLGDADINAWPRRAPSQTKSARRRRRA